MRALILLFVSSLVSSAWLFHCTSNPIGPPPEAPIDWHAFEVRAAADAGPVGPTARERGVSEAYARALASPQFADLSPMLDIGVHMAFPGMSDARGRDATVQAHEVLFGALDAREVEISRMWRTKDTQALEWTLSGTQVRAWFGVPPTHKNVVLHGVTLLWTRDNGAIIDVHVYFDVATVRAQLGVGPDGAPAAALHGVAPSSRAQLGVGPDGAPAAAPLGVPSSSSSDLAALLPASPARGAPVVFEQTGTTEERDNLTRVRAALDALEANDPAAYEASMADDAQVFTLESDNPIRGKAGATAYFRAMHKGLGQLDSTIDNAWAVAQFVILEYDLSGEQVGPLGWVPARRGKVVRIHIVDVIEMRQGKFANVWRYDNPGEILADAP